MDIQAALGSKENYRVNDGSGKVHLYVKQTKGGLTQDSSPVAESGDISAHVNQKKRLHMFLGCFCVSYCVRENRCSQNMKELPSNDFLNFILTFQGLLGPPGTTGDRGPMGEPVS